MPILSYARMRTDRYHQAPILKPGKKAPLASIGQFKGTGDNPTLMIMRAKDEPNHIWLAWPNFFSLLHYNRSYLYAFNAAIFASYLEEAYAQAYGQ